MASKDSKDSKDETAAFQARWTLLEAARLPGGAVWEPLRRHRSLDVVLVWAAAHAIHWLIQQPAEWLLLAVYSAAVVARLLALRPATAITWLAAWALADYVVYSLVLPATSATTASLMVHSVVVVKLQGLNLRGAGLLAIAAALVFARDPPQLTAWHRLMASHCTGAPRCPALRGARARALTSVRGRPRGGRGARVTSVWLRLAADARGGVRVRTLR